jgi:hypothetical protein
MNQNQLKELPSVSEVLLECKSTKILHGKYIAYIIKSELDGFRRMARIGIFHSTKMNLLK